jgi:hypothetical protein
MGRQFCKACELSIAIHMERETEIVDTSKWQVEQFQGDDDWGVIRPKEPGEIDPDDPYESPWHAVALCFLSRQEAEQYIRNYNTAVAQAERVAGVRPNWPQCAHGKSLAELFAEGRL